MGAFENSLREVSKSEIIDLYGGVLRARRRSEAKIHKAQKGFRRILSIGERHVDEATGRRIEDFREAIDVARVTLEGLDDQTT